MKCSACGNENQPGAKFCVHCGVVLSAAMGAPAVVPAPAQPAAPAPVPRPPAPAPAPAPTPMPSVSRPLAAAPTPATPPAAVTAPPAAPAAASRKVGLFVAAIAALIVLGAGGYFAYRLLGEEDNPAVAAVESPRAQETPATAAPSNDTVAPPATEQPAPSVATAPPVGTAPEAPPTSATTPAASSVPANPQSSLSGTTAPSESPEPAVKAPRPKVAKAAAGSDAGAKGTAQSAASASAKTVAKAPVAAPAPAPAPDRWQMFADALAACEKLDLFSRFGCQQRERWHYCEGYWGRVPQCPMAGPAPDHGS